mmetsp:Transcript_11809/g.29232  ORF Transcript_11809/g.29232 Transcript_11809/m.29232 type:complete len:247 (-) Transcript_11809:105-845(-)
MRACLKGVRAAACGGVRRLVVGGEDGEGYRCEGEENHHDDQRVVQHSVGQEGDADGEEAQHEELPEDEAEQPVGLERIHVARGGHDGGGEDGAPDANDRPQDESVERGGVRLLGAVAEDEELRDHLAAEPDERLDQRDRSAPHLREVKDWRGERYRGDEATAEGDEDREYDERQRGVGDEDEFVRDAVHEQLHAGDQQPAGSQGEAVAEAAARCGDGGAEDSKGRRDGVDIGEVGGGQVELLLQRV